MMTRAEVLARAEAYELETRELLADLEAAPSFIRVNPMATRARSAAVAGLALVQELADRVRREREDGNGE